MKIFLYLAAGVAVFAQAGTGVRNPKIMTFEERLYWFARNTYGPPSILVAGPLSSGLRTWRNTPEEWGPGWEGFGKRYGIRFVNNSVTNGLRVTSSAIWNEDPRYRRLGQGSFGARLKSVLKQSVMSYYGNGKLYPSASLAIGHFGSAHIQNLWMPASVSTQKDAWVRGALMYSGRLNSNFAREFFPLLRNVRFFKKFGGGSANPPRSGTSN